MSKNNSFTLRLAKFFKNLFLTLTLREVNKCESEKKRSVEKENDAEEALKRYKEQQKEYRKEQDEKKKEAEDLLNN
jgi:hypothetical protein